MKTIVAGSRTISDYKRIVDAIESSGIEVTELVCGGARGVDQMALRWARRKGLAVSKFPAAWRDKDGQIDRSAGFRRNAQMAEYAQALIAVWDGESGGTKHMINLASKCGLLVHVVILRGGH
jgi:hypothetical protein